MPPSEHVAPASPSRTSTIPWPFSHSTIVFFFDQRSTIAVEMERELQVRSPDFDSYRRLFLRHTTLTHRALSSPVEYPRLKLHISDTSFDRPPSQRSPLTLFSTLRTSSRIVRRSQLRELTSTSSVRLGSSIPWYLRMGFPRLKDRIRSSAIEGVVGTLAARKERSG